MERTSSRLDRNNANTIRPQYARCFHDHGRRRDSVVSLCLPWKRVGGPNYRQMGEQALDPAVSDIDGKKLCALPSSYTKAC